MTIRPDKCKDCELWVGGQCVSSACEHDPSYTAPYYDNQEKFTGGEGVKATDTQFTANDLERFAAWYAGEQKQYDVFDEIIIGDFLLKRGYTQIPVKSYLDSRQEECPCTCGSNLWMFGFEKKTPAGLRPVTYRVVGVCPACGCQEEY